MTPLPPRDSKPYRVQRSRRKGSRLPAGAVCVTRPSKWGNPYPAINGNRRNAVEMYRHWLRQSPAGQAIAAAARVELRGKVLACWCKVGEACHADILLAVANAP